MKVLSKGTIVPLKVLTQELKPFYNFTINLKIEVERDVIEFINLKEKAGICAHAVYPI